MICQDIPAAGPPHGAPAPDGVTTMNNGQNSAADRKPVVPAAKIHGVPWKWRRGRLFDSIIDAIALQSVYS